MDIKGIKAALQRLSEHPEVARLLSEKNGDPNSEFSLLQDRVRKALVLVTAGAMLLGKKRAAQAALLVEVVVLLVGLSYIVKTEVIDNPEVQEMMKLAWDEVAKQSEHVHKVAMEFIDRAWSRAYKPSA